MAGWTTKDAETTEWDGIIRARRGFEGDGTKLTGVTTTPAGADTQIQYNDSGNFGASSALVWHNASGALNINADALGGRFIILDRTANVQVSNKFCLGSDHATGGDDYMFMGHTGAGGQDDFTLTQTGKVGIGTTNPTTELEVNGTASAAIIHSSSTLQVSGAHFNVAADGNVGIGIAAPTHHLHVTSSSALTSIGVAPSAAITAADAQIIFSEDDTFTNGAIIRYDGGDNLLHFYGVEGGSPTGPWMAVTRGGVQDKYVGIGTGTGQTSIQATLHVKNAGSSNSFQVFKTETSVGDSFSVTNAGNVGVGTTTQTTDFSVKEKFGVSASGAHMIKLTNKSGANSIQGQVVEINSGQALSVSGAELSCVDAIGSIWNGGVSDGSEVWVQTGGIACVRMDDDGASVNDWIETSSNIVGRGEAQASPAASPEHFREIGHALTAAASGALCWINMHFN